MAAIQQICAEKGISEDRVIDTVEAALAAAYRKDFGKPSQNIRVTLSPEAESTTGPSFKIYQVYTVVESPETLEDSEREMILDDAKLLKNDVAVEEEIAIALPYHDELWSHCCPNC